MFFTILPGHILDMECPFGHSYGRIYKAQLSSKSRRSEVTFNLNNRLNALLNLKEISTLLYAFSLEIHPFKLLKSVKGGGREFWDAVLWLCFKLPNCIFCHTRDTSVI